MREKIIDDLTGMMGGAAGILSDIRDHVRGDMRDRMKVMADRIDLASRDDLSALEARVAALETALAALGTKPAAKTGMAKQKPKAKAVPKKKKQAAR